MTLDQVKALVKTTINDVVPSNTSRGSTAFRHASDEKIKASALDKFWQLSVSRPPTRLGQVSTTTPRFHTGLAANFYYTPKQNVVETIDDAANDQMLIQNALCAQHATLLVVGEGLGLFNPYFDVDDAGRLVSVVEFTVQHT